MMAAVGSSHFPHRWEIRKSHGHNLKFQSAVGSVAFPTMPTSLSSLALRQDYWGKFISDRLRWTSGSVPYRCCPVKCYSFLNSAKAFEGSSLKIGAQAFSSALQGGPFPFKLVPPIGIIVFAVWGLGPLMRQSRIIFFHKSDNSWRRSGMHYVMTSYLQPLLLWTGAMLICRVLDPVVLRSESSQIVKQRLLTFVKSLSTVLAFAYCLSCVIQQAQKFFMETSDSTDARNMGFQFAGKAVYTAVWVAAVSLFMELLGFSTQKMLTAGGLGTVLLTLAGREIFTNFLSSVMIHATRPFVVNEWIQTKIEGYEVSGTVEHVGWWSPTIVRGEDREAVHIPNHKFTVNVVRNLSQKTHWRIKTHLAISHFDVNKINNIVADMRKVLAKNPQVEQQKLHRRIFLENVNPENQALLILVSCFVKTSHFEEYLCVKEAILLDLLRVISHHRARLATPIRTVQKIYKDSDLEGIPFADESAFNRSGAASSHPLLLIEPHNKINGEDKTKVQTRQENKSSAKLEKSGTKLKERIKSDVKASEKKTSDSLQDSELNGNTISETKENHKVAAAVSSSVKARLSDSVEVKSEVMLQKDSNSNDKVQGTDVSPTNNSSQQKNAGERDGSFPSPSTAEKKREAEKLTLTEVQATRPVMEDNIVLGVALEGSKRTLPIEEEISPSLLAEEKEMATCRTGNGSATVDKEKKDGKVLSATSAGDQQ